MKASNSEEKSDFTKSQKPFSVGVIGAGDVAAKSHLPTLLALEDVNVSWIADLNGKLAKKVADNYGVAWLPMPSELNELPHTDIVLLAIPYGAREPYYQVLRNRETAIYVEKPAATTVSEFHERRCDFSSPLFAVGFQRRSLGSVRLLRDIVASQAFGALTKVEFRHGGSANVLSGKAFSSDSTLAAGGILFEHACHGLDLALFISAAQSAKAHRVHTIIEKGFDVHAEGQIKVMSQISNFDLDFKISWLSEVGEGLTFYFANAVAVFSLVRPGIAIKSHDGKTLFTIADDKDLYPKDGFQSLAEFWRSFLEAIRQKRENHTSLNSFLLVTDVIEQIYARKVDS